MRTPSPETSPIIRAASGSKTRRAFLQLSSASAAAAGLSVSAHAATKAVKPAGKSKDVIVIGGGFAGVTAARELTHRGLNVLLLEARNRLGGRTFTSRFGDDEVELGGFWVHWSQPHVWTEIMRYGMEIVDTWHTGISNRVLLMSGNKVREISLEEYGAKLSELNQRYFADSQKIIERPYQTYLSEVGARYDHMSAADRLKEIARSKDEWDIMIPTLGLYFLGKASEGAYTELVHEWAQGGRNEANMNEAATRYKLKHGTISLINRIMEDGGYEVRLSAAVAQIEQNERGVTVVTEDGSAIQSRFVVVAVPVNTLNSIDFQPKLQAAKQNMARERHAGIGRKVYMRVTGAFGPTIYAPDSEPLSMVSPYHVYGTDRAMLLGFGSNSTAGGFDAHDPKSVQAFLMKFTPGVQVTETLSYDWDLDPYSQGVHCLFRPGQWTRYLQGLRQRENRLFFAGGDIASGWRGYIDGAIESGLEVAQSVVGAARGNG